MLYSILLAAVVFILGLAYLAKAMKDLDLAFEKLIETSEIYSAVREIKEYYENNLQYISKKQIVEKNSLKKVPSVETIRQLILARCCGIMLQAKKYKIKYKDSAFYEDCAEIINPIIENINALILLEKAVS